MIEITCAQDGFRRAGVTHPKGLTAYQEDAFSDEQLMIMAGEKKLIVAVVGDGEGVIADLATQGHRFKSLYEACEDLDPDKSNVKDWTKSGVPQTAALEMLSGVKDVSAADRDDVFALFSKGNSK